MDVNNLWYNCRDCYGYDARIDFLSLIKKVSKSGYREVPRKVLATAYTITSPYRRELPNGKILEDTSRNEYFLNMLRKFGYRVKTRRMRFEKGRDKPYHTDWDVGITVDALMQMGSFATFALASGDGDYVPLLEQLQKKGKRVEVYTFQQNSSKMLFEHTDHVFYLDEKNIFQQPNKPGEDVNGDEEETDADASSDEDGDEDTVQKED